MVQFVFWFFSNVLPKSTPQQAPQTQTGMAYALSKNPGNPNRNGQVARRTAVPDFRAIQTVACGTKGGVGHVTRDRETGASLPAFVVFGLRAEHWQKNRWVLELVDADQEVKSLHDLVNPCSTCTLQAPLEGACRPTTTPCRRRGPHRVVHATAHHEVRRRRGIHAGHAAIVAAGEEVPEQIHHAVIPFGLS